jgi:pathogenesis-related protein 1
LSISAAKWAGELKKKCNIVHSQADGYGENLWMGTSGYYSPTDMIDSWASEKEDYSYKNNKCKPGKVCGHYTQIVWKNTTEVGCATVQCKDFTILVCQYTPPGNWVGEKPY